MNIHRESSLIFIGKAVSQLHNPPLRLWALGSAWVRTLFEVDRSIAEIEGFSSFLVGCSSWVFKFDFAGPIFWALLKFST